MNSDNDMPDLEDDDVVVGGGPRDDEDASKVAPNPNPDAVHPDYSQTVPGAPAPAPTTEPAPAPDSGQEKAEGSDNES